MTTVLPTPAAWPRPLLGEAPTGDPADLDAAVRDGAFAGLARALNDLGATLTTATLAESGLRGRGGAGFPAAEKWRAVAASPDGTRYAVANGYEADPAGGTNHHLMLARPYAIVEGLAIAALAVGAEEAIIAVRAEYADAIAVLEQAVAAADGGRLSRRRRAGLGTCAPDDRPRRAGRLHAGRGDGPAQGPGRAPRPAGAAAALSIRARAVGPADARPQRRHARGRPLDRGPRRRRLSRDRRPGRPGHGPGGGQRGGGDARHRGGADGDLARGDRRARRAASRTAGRSRRSWSAVRPAACCRPTSRPRRTRSGHSGQPGPTSGPGRSSSPTTGPASWTWHAC